jgi:DNA-binding PadR family transcriptional regulator
MKVKGDNLGEFEELVLLAAATLNENAYGVSVMQFIVDETGRNVNISAVHEVLKRLERKKYLRSKMGGATTLRGGRRKRFFQLTNSGKQTLDDAIRLKMQLYKRVGLTLKLS